MSFSLLRVRNERPRPSRKIASRIDVLPAPFSPAMRFSSGENSSVADSMQRRFSMRSSARDIDAALRARLAGSEPHRHDDVLRTRRARGANQAAAIAVSQSENDLFRIDGGQGIEEVRNVEADFNFVAFVFNLDLVFRLFLFGVMCLDRDEIRLQIDANSAILLV